MDTTDLSRHYAVLTPWERVPLLVAAVLRDDEVEAQRLAQSAPRTSCQVADYFGLMQALRELLMDYMLLQSDTTAALWQVGFAMGCRSKKAIEEEPGIREDGLRNRLRLLSYVLIVRADGFRLLCEDLGFDPEMLLELVHGYERVRRMEQRARDWAFSAEELIAYVRSLAPPRDAAVERCYEVDTAQDIAASMRASFEEQLARYSGTSPRPARVSSGPLPFVDCRNQEGKE